MNAKVRLIHRVGSKHEVVWTTPLDSKNHYHRHVEHISEEEREKHDFAKYEAMTVKCDACGQEFKDPSVSFGTEPVYDTPGGKPEPGDCWYTDYMHETKDGKVLCPYWDNCDPRGHLIFRLPTNNPSDTWDSDSRASNCKKPQDRTHRCWVKKGEPPNVSVVAGGCGGSFSIGHPSWHGYLREGNLVQ